MPAIALNIKIPAIFSLSQNSGYLTEETLQESMNMPSRKLFFSLWHAGKRSCHRNSENRLPANIDVFPHVFIDPYADCCDPMTSAMLFGCGDRLLANE
jgi:hypothetical protein